MQRNGIWDERNYEFPDSTSLIQTIRYRSWNFAAGIV